MVTKNDLERFKNATQFKQTPKRGEEMKHNWKDIHNEWCMTLSQFIYDESRSCDEETFKKYDEMSDRIGDLIKERADLED